MLSIQNYILVDTIANKYTNSLLLEGNASEIQQGMIQDGVLIISASYVDIGIPISEVTVSLNGTAVAKGDEIMDVYDAFEAGKYQEAYSALVKVANSSEESAKQIADDAEKTDDISELNNVKLDIKSLRIYPPKCQKFGVYLEADTSVEVSDPTKQPDVKIKPTNLVLGELGKVNLTMVFKLMLKCAKLYGGLYATTFNSILINPENDKAKPIDDKAMEDEMLNVISKAIKTNAGEIKKADDEGKADEEVKSLLTKEVLTEIIAAAK